MIATVRSEYERRRELHIVEADVLAETLPAELGLNQFTKDLFADIHVENTGRKAIFNVRIDLDSVAPQEWRFLSPYGSRPGP